MARKGYITHGVDLSREYTKSLSIRGGKLGVLHRPTVSLARVEETGLRSCLADGIIFSEVLEHLPDERPALNEAYRLLKSDGRLFVTVPANPDLWSRADQAAGHYRRYGKVELEKLLEESNFNDIKVWPWGTLVTRMYEKLVFIPWMSTRAERGQSPGAGGCGGQLAKMRIVSFPLSWGLSLDALFSWLPTGTGWIAVARKTGG
jgi:SAM-dependent methyltransferase